MHRVGQVPMFQSFEMSNTEQESRFDSMKSKVSHRRLLDGALSKEEESRYKDWFIEKYIKTFKSNKFFTSHTFLEAFFVYICIIIQNQNKNGKSISLLRKKRK